MILAIQKNTLTRQQKANLTKKGYVVIECDNPENVRVIVPEVSIQTDSLLMASLHALQTKFPTSRTDFFVNELYRRLGGIELESITTPPQP